MSKEAEEIAKNPCYSARSFKFLPYPAITGFLRPCAGYRVQVVGVTWMKLDAVAMAQCSTVSSTGISTVALEQHAVQNAMG